MELLNSLETICRIVIRAREMEAQVPSESDEGEEPDNIDDNPDGDDGEALSVLDDEVNTAVEEELTALFDDLGEDQLAEVIALAWVGRGTYDALEWDEAFQEATDVVTDSRDAAAQELMEMPLLAADLDAGLAAFDLSCEGIGQLD